MSTNRPRPSIAPFLRRCNPLDGEASENMTENAKTAPKMPNTGTLFARAGLDPSLDASAMPCPKPDCDLIYSQPWEFAPRPCRLPADCALCERFVCSRCERIVSWVCGSADDMPAVCSNCWVFLGGEAASNEAGGP